MPQPSFVVDLEFSPELLRQLLRAHVELELRDAHGEDAVAEFLSDKESMELEG